MNILVTVKRNFVALIRLKQHMNCILLSVHLFFYYAPSKENNIRLESFSFLIAYNW